MMRVLTVRQPWAGAMFAELTRDRKDIENRTWQPPARGRIAIHAGLADDPEGWAHPIIAARIARGEWPLGDFGAVIGSVDVVRWHRAPDECVGEGCLTMPATLGDPVIVSNEWAQFPEYVGPGARPLWHWTLRGPRPYVTPIPARGQLGLWTPGPTLAGQIRDAEAEAS